MMYSATKLEHKCLLYGALTPGTISEALSWLAVGFDTDSFSDLVTDDTKLTIPVGLDGDYRIKFGCQYSTDLSATINNLQLELYKNGVTTGGSFTGTAKPHISSSANNNGLIHIIGPELLALAAGDYLQLYGKGFPLVSADIEQPWIEIEKVG